VSSDLVRISKFLSLVLRHQPERIGLSLDAHGWAAIEDLIEQARAHGVHLTRELIGHIVATSDKKRFASSADGKMIRANQGHSIDIELDLEPRQPPEILFHGTAHHALVGIRTRGLQSGTRRHVHLTSDEQAARKVGARHGRPVVLQIRAGGMWREGWRFYLSDNGVWLTDQVPVEYIGFPNGV